MRVLLAAPPHRDTFGYSLPPPGLLRLGGALADAGFDVGLEDLALELARGALPAGAELVAASAERLLARAPSMLGLTTMGATLPLALAIAARVKQRAPATFVALGGPGCGGVDAARVERFACVDAVARGEGELTAVELARAVGRGAALAGIAGLTWRGADGRAERERERAPLGDLELLPDYAWGLLPPIAEYKAVTGEPEGLVALDSGRGCAYDCSFCSIGRYWSRRSRALPAERLAREIESLAAVPGARRAYLSHDLFGADRRQALALCDALVARGSPLPWEARARLDHVDRELAAAMGRAGCVRVLIGLESADGALRNAHGKAMDRHLDVLERVGGLLDAGIAPILSCLLGLPGEGERELAATLDLALACALRGGVYIALHLPNPQPGCRLGDEHGRGARPVPGIAPDMALGCGETPEELALIEAHPDLFSTFAALVPEPGGAAGLARLRELAELREHLAPALTHAPRSFALAARALGADVLATFRAWRASGAELGDFVARSAGGLGRATWEWEAAQRACSAPGARTQVLESAFDLAELAPALAAGGAFPSVRAERTFLAVAPGRRGVRTLRVSAALAAVLSGRRAASAAEHAALEAAGLEP